MDNAGFDSANYDFDPVWVSVVKIAVIGEEVICGKSVGAGELL